MVATVLPPVARRCATYEVGRKVFVRNLNLVEMFSKTKREERRQALEEDLRKGYFDDLKEFKTNGGKVFPTVQKLIAPGSSMPFPSVEASGVDSNPVDLLDFFPGKAATLVCVAFRNNTENMIRSWSLPFREHFDTDRAEVIELSFVESPVLRMKWARGLVVRMLGSAAPTALESRVLVSFADSRSVCKQLGMSSKLSAYAFLVDRRGLVRWKGCGLATEEEQSHLVKCAERMVS